MATLDGLGIEEIEDLIIKRYPDCAQYQKKNDRTQQQHRFEQYDNFDLFTIFELENHIF